MKHIWESMSLQARAGLAIGLVLIIVLVGGLARWALGKDYEVLFADLNQQDASAMTAELDRLKQPYEIAQNGTAILVPADAVARTRLKLVAKNLPAHGGVGFEIFNNVDYGMTEFAQKVNYQRALQGELTRTILALDEIQSARVHLAIPDPGLFKREENHPKASVTLAMKPGRSLDKTQVTGIQRLVSAAVSDMDARDVTVLDSTGAALSAAGTQQGADSGDWKLEAKRQVETYLTHKLDALIDKALGPGRGSATVDAELNLDNIKVTAEEVLPAVGSTPEDHGAGVLVRERMTTRSSSGASAPVDATAIDATVTNSDNEYAVGRRIQQVVSTPGSIKHVSVGVVLPADVGEAQIAQLRGVLGAAAGLDHARGDSIAFYASVDGHGVAGANVDSPSAMPPMPEHSQDADAVPGTKPAHRQVSNRMVITILGMMLALLGIGLIAWYAATGARLRRTSLLNTDPATPLTDAQRNKLLEELRTWLTESGAV